MDRDVVTAKLESLRRCVERVRTRTPASVEELSASHDAQDIIGDFVEFGGAIEAVLTSRQPLKRALTVPSAP